QHPGWLLSVSLVVADSKPGGEPPRSPVSRDWRVGNISEQVWGELRERGHRDPQLEAAWRMLQHLYGIYLAEDSDQANQALEAFIQAHQDHPLPEFDKIIGALIDWGDEIFAFHDTDRASNGRLEGINGKLGVLKRVAYGFVNADNLRLRVELGRRSLAVMPG